MTICVHVCLYMTALGYARNCCTFTIILVATIVEYDDCSIGTILFINTYVFVICDVTVVGYVRNVKLNYSTY